MVAKEEFIKTVSSGRGRKTKYDAEKHIGLLYDTFIVGEAISAFCSEALISQSTFFKSLLGIFPAACGVIWRNEQIYT